MVLSLTEVVETQHFVARRAELQEIQKNLSSDGRRRCVVLHGLGGIGKTQLALAYALRQSENYSAIFWLNAKDEDSIKSSFARTAKQIHREHASAPGLAASDQQNNVNQMVEATKAWLSMPMNTRWLIIYDNHDSPALPGVSDPAAFDLRGYIPEAYHGSIIVTTRSSQGLPGLSGHYIPIKKLENIQDSLKILRDLSGRENVMTGMLSANCKRIGSDHNRCQRRAACSETGWTASSTSNGRCIPQSEHSLFCQVSRLLQPVMDQTPTIESHADDLPRPCTLLHVADLIRADRAEECSFSKPASVVGIF